MKFSLLLICMVTLVIHQVNPAKILVISFFSTKSHKLTYQPLIEELGKRGHQITVVSPVKAAKEVENVKEIHTLDMDKLLHSDKMNFFESKQNGSSMGFNPATMIQIVMDVCRMSYELPQVKALLNEKFDLAFLQPFFNDCVLGLVYRLQAPFVLFTPVSVPSFIAEKVGTYFPPAVTPNTMLGYPANMTFLQRVKSFGLDAIMHAGVTFYYEPKAEALYKEMLGDDIPGLSEIYANASLVLSNGHFSLGVGGIKAVGPDIVDVGGIHSRPAKPIPKNLEDFISKGKDGFILFSMGSAIKGDTMPNEKRAMILRVFSKLKQQVLWKWESESMPDLPKNVMLSKWLPQQDLLGHKDIKMFITHCGGGSTEEAIYHGVPLIGIPMMADQGQNAALAKRNRLLVELAWNDMTEGDFEAAINEVLNNPKYKDNAKKLSSLFRDRPMDPLDLGVYWIEYVLRHKGAPHLRNAGRQLNVLQYLSLDVIAFYLTILGIALYVIFIIIKLLLKIVCKCFQRKTTPIDKGKKLN